MPSVLVTGGTGFCGFWMRQTQPEWAECTYLSRAQYESMDWYREKWDYIVHLAPVSPARVLQCAINHNSRVLFASSGAAYDQLTAYAENKRDWEMLCILSGVNAVIARLFTFYGEHLDDKKAITQFVKCAREGQPIHIWGDGNTIRSYMHGRTMARQMWAILLKGVRLEAYDVGDTVPVTMLELARMVVRYVRKVPIIIEGREEVCPVYLPRRTAKTRGLL